MRESRLLRYVDMLAQLFLLFLGTMPMYSILVDNRLYCLLAIPRMRCNANEKTNIKKEN